MWTKEGLQSLVKARLADKLLVVAANREPYVHNLEEGEVRCQKPASGLVTALDPVMQACSSALWVAHGSGSADRQTADDKGRLLVPPEDPKYTLKRVWLTKEEVDGFYFGFSNEALWPLSHIVYARPMFKEEDWQQYVRVNRLFAQAILEEIGDRQAYVWIQDYHFCLMAKYIKEVRSDITCGLFWHIPWPNPEAFRINPHKVEILEGLLANDLLGFHIRYHCDNFLATVDLELEARVDRERSAVVRRGHETRVHPFPISVDFETISSEAQQPKVGSAIAELRESFCPAGVESALVGLDRLDYTKGIPERILAVGRLLEKHPEYIGKIVLLQIGEVSRIHIPRYQELNEEINRLVEEINWKYSRDAWSPIVLVRKHFTQEEIWALYRMADVCVVSSLHDGMNLVAKEFVSARTDLGGVLVLSRFTGAARELRDSLLVNPYDLEQMADSFHQALTMPADEKMRRMERMREVVKNQNIYRWAGSFLAELAHFPLEEM